MQIISGIYSFYVNETNGISLIWIRAKSFSQDVFNSSWQNINDLLSMPYDDHILISSSSDGSLFVYLFDPNKLKLHGFDENFEFNYIISSENEEKENNNNKCNINIIDVTINDYSVQGEKYKDN